MTKISRKFHSIALICLALLAAPSLAAAAGMGNWQLVGDQSMLAFGSVKSGKVGEIHHFKNLTGKASDAGQVDVSIALGSVETNIPIRNERMIEFLFGGADATASLSATVDGGVIGALQPGQTTLVPVQGTLEFNGESMPMRTEMFVARLSAQRLLVTTDKMIMLSTAEAGIDAGIDKLMEVAGLPSIERVSPVTLRLVFEAQ